MSTIKHAKKGLLNPLSISISAAVLASTLSISSAQAGENPFASIELNKGFMLAAHPESKDAEGKCGEGKCGGKKGDKKKDAEGKCGEGKCGEGKKEGKDAEGKCGEGKCGSKS